MKNNLPIKHLFLWYILLLLPSLLFAQEEAPSLLHFDDQPTTSWSAKSVAEVQMVPVNLNSDLLQAIRNENVERFHFNTISDDIHEVTITRVIEHVDDSWSFIGHINNNWENSFTLSVSEERVLSAIHEVNQHQYFEIKYIDGLSSHVMVEVDPHKRDEISCGVHDDFVVGDSTNNQSLIIPEYNQGKAVIDVMIVYTPNAETWAQSNSSGINNVINQAMAIAQASVDNSGLDLEFRLVHRARVNYTETGDSGSDLQNLSFGNITNVHNLRDQYGADLVAMFTRTNDVGGFAWVLNSTSGRSEIGYSITRVQQAGWSNTHAHELGHNMGNDHSRNQTTEAAGNTGGLFNYSTGWRWTGQDGMSYASVMTYPEGSRKVDIYSNPNISYQGTPTGSYSGAYAPADNARSMSEIKHTVAGYRPTRFTVEPPSVSTRSISSITESSAQTGGNVSDDGGATVTSRGVCWSTNQNPNQSDSCISSGSGTGSYTVTMNGLNPDTRYYVRAYATNSAGTRYGNQRNFTTLDIPADPNLSTITSSDDRIQANDRETSSITVTAIDENGNTLQGYDVTLITTEGRLRSDRNSATTNSNGEAEFNVRNNRAETVVYSAIIENVEIHSSVSVTFIPIDAELSFLEVSTAKVLSNGSAEAIITIYARDEEDRPFRNVNIELDQGSGNSAIDAVQNTTDSDGMALFRVSNNNAEQVNYTASALGVSIAQQAQVNFVTVDPAISTVSVQPERVQADNQQEAVITVTAKDEDGDVLEGALVEITAESGSSKLSDSKLLTNEEGKAVFTVTNSRPESIKYQIIAEGIELAQDATVHFIPIAPVSLAATDVETRQFVSNWEVVDGAEGYLLDVATDSSFTNFVSGYQAYETGNVTSQAVNGVQPGTDYYYRVRAQSMGLVGANSETIPVTTFPDIPEAISASDRNALRFTANWQAAEGARNYRLDVSDDPDFQSFVAGYNDTDVGDTQSETVTGLTLGTDYYYRVRSEAGPRVSASSATIQTSTLSVNRENSEISSDQLRILADGNQTNTIEIVVKSDDGYELENLKVSLKPEGGSSEIEEMQPVTNESGIALFGVTNTAAEKVTYEVQVETISLGEISVEFLQDEGVLKLGDNYPNPFDYQTTIPVTVPRPMAIELTIYNSLGTPVRTIINEDMETGYYEIPFHTNELAAGIYFYRLYTDEQVKTEKMVFVK